MKKVLLGFTILFGLLFILLTGLVWYAGKIWGDKAVYDIQSNSKAIFHAKKALFENDYPCLIFMEGKLYHGQDTFEVIKFKINVQDPSWSTVSNIIWSAGYGNSAQIVCDKREDQLPSIVREHAVDDEVALFETSWHQLSVYVTQGRKNFDMYLYGVGRMVPQEVLDLTENGK